MPRCACRGTRLCVWCEALLQRSLGTAPVAPASQGELEESHLLGALRLLALDTGYLFFHDYDSRQNDAGLPDTLIARPGELIMAELKTRTGKLTMDQQRWLSVCDGARVSTYTWRPADWDTIVARLTGPRSQS